MAKDFTYNPGDVLHVENNPHNNYGGEGNYLIIGQDTQNYYYHVLKLASEKIHACSLISIYFNVRDTEKIGKVDLKQLPLEELIKLASEDGQGRRANAADLEYLKDCDVLKQYIL
ncbi:MAG: hypothetical protein PHO02_05340 [Candidatus Nanoarchaeia archaeon]|nr:hypothetical protein [Candidatus Nanoarchaeia archaeon]